MLRKIFVIALLSLLTMVASAQNSTSSPYSRYGYGKLVEPTSSQGRAMGGLSAGLRHKQYINSGNPASYTAIDSLTFRFELGASACTSFYYYEGEKSHDISGNIEGIELQFPIRKWLGLAFGMKPYSVVGYNYNDSISTKSNIEGGELKYVDNYRGDGGINQLYLGLGFRPWKSFSFGCNLRLMFGSINTSSSVNFSPAAHSGFYHTMVQKNRIKVRDFSVNLGAQYEISLPEEKSIVVGVTFEPKSTLGTDATKDITTAGVDTVSLTFDDQFDLPMQLGFGLSYNVKDKLIVGADYKIQKWEAVRYFGEKPFTDRKKLSIGAEFLPNTMSKKYLRRMSYRLGFTTANTYYNVNGETINENALSAGFGFPLRRGFNPTMINFTAEYGFNAVSGKDLMKENHLKFILSATINERWFVRRRLE